MDNPKIRRIESDFEKVSSLNKKSDLIYVEPLGNDHTYYRVTYRCKGLMKSRINGEIVETDFHAMEIYLHKDYPRKPPRLIWLTDVFHPNILSHLENGGVCIGKWSPMETLDALIIRIGEMVQYRGYNIRDALNEEAKKWAEENLNRFPVDTRPLLKQPPEEKNEKIIL
jgi:ubiquitin-protein ligase